MQWRRFWVKFSTAVLVLGILSFTVLHERQNIFDWWRLRNYQAPVAVSQLATDDTMTGYARKILYVNHPSIEDKVMFTKNCPNNGGEKTVVLGCYHSDQQGIFLLSVTDSRLDGVEEVTAAHEMLHAAYDRLSDQERSYVDGLLMNYYQHDLHDQRILNTITEYKQTEPNDWVNEMHSVFGTEIASLPVPLENYYRQYFTDRKKIAAYAAQYESAFTTRQNEVSTDDVQLMNWKTKISSDEGLLQTQQKAISASQTQLEQLKTSGAVDQYNADISAYNIKVDSYNSLVTSVRSLVGRYNQLVSSRNAIALEEDQLAQDITATPSTISQ